MNKTTIFCLFLIFLSVFSAKASPNQKPEQKHLSADPPFSLEVRDANGALLAVHRPAFSMHGAPALPDDFTHFHYVRPDAPKGGALRLGVLGGFDTLNTLTFKGNPASVLMPYIVQPLMMRSADEPFTFYALVAQSVALPEDRGFVEFRINPKARFSDGHAILARDVLFTWNLLTKHGRPSMRENAKKVKKVELRDEWTIRFTFFSGEDRELPLILALMPVLAEHATHPADFEKNNLTPFLGSGPYQLDSIEPGSQITLKRRPDYWGQDLPSQRGLYNFDRLEYHYFRDSNTLFEAFMAGLLDYRVEIDPLKWQRDYQTPRVLSGEIKQENVPIVSPKGMSGFVMNTRRHLFRNINTRKALFYIFDFEWINKNFFNNTYTRTRSFFDESELAFHASPLDPIEEKAHGTALATLPEAILDGTWHPPISDGTGRDRAQLNEAKSLLESDGYKIIDGVMREVATLEPVSFEILVPTREKERLALAFAEQAAILGIKINVRLVDATQYLARLRRFDFDCVIESFPVSASPGQEQANRWSSRAAKNIGTFNFAGVENPVIDQAIERLLSARQRQEFTASVRALDRLLLSGYYVLPLYHFPQRLLALTRKVQHPPTLPRYDLTPDSFWIEK